MDIKKLPFKQYDVWKRKSGAMGYIMEIDLVKNNFVTYTITANYNNLKYKETKLKPRQSPNIPPMLDMKSIIVILLILSYSARKSFFKSLNLRFSLKF